MLSTDELQLKYGNIVRKEHKVALNQLTKIMNRDQTNADITGPTFRHSAALCRIDRVIKQPEFMSVQHGLRMLEDAGEHVRIAAVKARHKPRRQRTHEEMQKTKTLGLVENSGLSLRHGRQSQTTNVTSTYTT